MSGGAGGKMGAGTGRQLEPLMAAVFARWKLVVAGASRAAAATAAVDTPATQGRGHDSAAAARGRRRPGAARRGGGGDAGDGEGGGVAGGEDGAGSSSRPWRRAVAGWSSSAGRRWTLQSLARSLRIPVPSRQALAFRPRPELEQQQSGALTAIPGNATCRLPLCDACAAAALASADRRRDVVGDVVVATARNGGME